jgi:hypothetical protein
MYLDHHPLERGCLIVVNRDLAIIGTVVNSDYWILSFMEGNLVSTGDSVLAQAFSWQPERYVTDQVVRNN